MPLLQETLEVGRPLDEVFAFVGDFANTKDWDPGVASSRKVTDGPVGVGTRYAVDVLFGSRTLPMTYEITAWDPPNRVVLRGQGSTVTAVDDIRFEATERGTRVRYSADLRLKGLLKLAEPFMRGRFDRTAKDAIAGMRRALEGGPPS
ncbi:MAG TPA: SRPBCC family protein [Actinomycetota bacterium]|nr:SRPBCC family protein [Actinomycetota bacterium]